MGEKIKILFIHHGVGIGGAPTSLLNLIKKLSPEKFSTKIAFVQNSEVIELFKREGIKTEVINAPAIWFGHAQTGKIQWHYFYQYWNIYRHWQRTAYKVAPAYLAEQDFDIIHLNSHVMTSWACAAKKNGAKVVLHNRETVSRGYFGLRYQLLKSLITRYCDHIINISQDNKRRLGIEKNASVVYNFVDIPSQYRPSMHKSTNNRKVLYLGGMASIKGYETVVACLPYLDDKITLQFAGHYAPINPGRSFIDRLKKLVKLTIYRKTYLPVKEMHAALNAEVLGLLQKPLPIIDACDILITPFKIEHFSRPAIEAFAYGKPVIGSNVEGMDEIIDHGVNGMIVEKSNPRALAAAINYLCSNPDIAQKMGKEGRKKAKTLFSPEPNIRKIESIYQDLMHGNQP